MQEQKKIPSANFHDLCQYTDYNSFFMKNKGRKCKLSATLQGLPAFCEGFILIGKRFRGGRSGANREVFYAGIFRGTCFFYRGGRSAAHIKYFMQIYDRYAVEKADERGGKYVGDG